MYSADGILILPSLALAPLQRPAQPQECLTHWFGECVRGKDVTSVLGGIGIIIVALAVLYAAAKFIQSPKFGDVMIMVVVGGLLLVVLILIAGIAIGFFTDSRPQDLLRQWFG